MQKWMTTMLVAAALVCPATLLRAQQAPALPPAPDPAAPQPANNGDDADDEARTAAAAEQDAQAEAVDAQTRDKQQIEELRALAERQRAIALRAGQVADGAGGRIVFRGKTEKAGWLGVVTSKVPAALRHQLKLKHKYIGLIVERVEPNSPADEAGLEQFDIIERVNDQWVVNSEQFSVLLRMQEPGAEVTLAVIRQGEPQQLKAKLVEKELPVLGMNEFNMIAPAAAAVAGEGLNWVHVAPRGEIIFRDGRLEPLMDLHARLDKAEHFTYTQKDDEHTLKLTIKDGERHLEASDADGVVIFEGPINTDEERGNVPEEIREKVEKLGDMPGAKTEKAPPATAPAGRGF